MYSLHITIWHNSHGPKETMRPLVHSYSLGRPYAGCLRNLYRLGVFSSLVFSLFGLTTEGRTSPLTIWADTPTSQPEPKSSAPDRSDDRREEPNTTVPKEALPQENPHQKPPTFPRIEIPLRPPLIFNWCQPPRGEQQSEEIQAKGQGYNSLPRGCI